MVFKDFWKFSKIMISTPKIKVVKSIRDNVVRASRACVRVRKRFPDIMGTSSSRLTRRREMVRCTVKIPYVDLGLPQRHFRELLEIVRISSSRVSVAVREILFKKIDGASKIIPFKKVYQKRII